MKELLVQIRQFNDERDWDQFHSPKNLAMALMVETAEVAERFQWLSADESKTLPEDKLIEVAEELGDVLIYLVNLADKLGIDLNEAALDKLGKNRKKYPAGKVRGSSKKYTEY